MSKANYSVNIVSNTLFSGEYLSRGSGTGDSVYLSKWLMNALNNVLINHSCTQHYQMFVFCTISAQWSGHIAAHNQLLSLASGLLSGLKVINSWMKTRSNLFDQRVLFWCKIKIKRDRFYKYLIFNNSKQILDQLSSQYISLTISLMIRYLR